MTDRTYNILELSSILNISTTAVCELRRRLGMRQVDDVNLRILQYTTNKIRKEQKAVTTSTINMHFEQEERERQYGLEKGIRRTKETE